MTCFAYNDDGTICGQPGVMIDEQRARTVCAAHKPKSATVAREARQEQRRWKQEEQKLGWPALIATSIYLFAKDHWIVGTLPLLLIAWNIVGLKMLKKNMADARDSV